MFTKEELVLFEQIIDTHKNKLVSDIANGVQYNDDLEELRVTLNLREKVKNIIKTLDK